MVELICKPTWAWVFGLIFLVGSGQATDNASNLANKFGFYCGHWTGYRLLYMKKAANNMTSLQNINAGNFAY
ncbi:hypothetical protein ACS0TY_024963 [Phlomoides rotata]